MIKVKIQNPTEDRNRPTFAPFFRCLNLLKDYSIEITKSDDFDYLFVGMNDFIDKQISLKDSVNYGLENLSKISGDYFLFDGSDSTSLMGAYEVFKDSDAIYLFKNQKLKNKDHYKVPYAFNKFFFGSGSEIDLSYDITDDDWSRIKFSHNNLGYWNDYSNHLPISKDKNIDLCAIFNAVHKKNKDHGVRNDLLYTEHRKSLWDKVSPLKEKYNMLTEKKPFQEYIQNLHNSKISLSPFGMGELCFRDLESMVVGTIILKPSHAMVDTLPNLMIDDETFISCEYDWSDLEEKIDYILSNFDYLNEKLNHNIRTIFNKNFTYDNFCRYYYEMFSNLSGVNSYE
tara:strand:- start:3339 stop:4364 length:1026 start_codon:yes stop_codon:yes gene_type:complete